MIHDSFWSWIEKTALSLLSGHSLLNKCQEHTRFILELEGVEFSQQTHLMFTLGVYRFMFQGDWYIPPPYQSFKTVQLNLIPTMFNVDLRQNCPIIFVSSAIGIGSKKKFSIMFFCCLDLWDVFLLYFVVMFVICVHILNIIDGQKNFLKSLT